MADVKIRLEWKDTNRGLADTIISRSDNPSQNNDTFVEIVTVLAPETEYIDTVGDNDSSSGIVYHYRFQAKIGDIVLPLNSAAVSVAVRRVKNVGAPVAIVIE